MDQKIVEKPHWSAPTVELIACQQTQGGGANFFEEQGGGIAS
jgi:hypothetical protein